MKIKNHSYNYVLSFALPIFIICIIFMGLKLEPFGGKTNLVYDEIQQYVDLFNYARHAILSEPSSIIFTMSKGFGGGMLGTWAYYLINPCNLILLFFKRENMTIGIAIDTIFQYGLAGLSFDIMLSKIYKRNRFLFTGFAIAYSFCGFIVDNQFNIVWMCVSWLLPMIFLGLVKLTKDNNGKLYTISLAILFLCNYYMGFIIGVWTIMLFMYEEAINCTNSKQLKQNIKKYIISSITAILVNAWLLIPTYLDLKQSKLLGGTEKLKHGFYSSFLAPCVKLGDDMFSVHEIKNYGMPAVYIGSVALIGLILYFFNHKITIREKIASFVIIITLMFANVNKVLGWFLQGFNYPIWYEFRFSIIFCFFAIYLAVRNFQTQIKPTWTALISTTVIMALLITYIICQKHNYKFDNKTAIKTTIICFSLALISTLIIKLAKYKIAMAPLMTIMIIEVMINGGVSLNKFDYEMNYVYQNAYPRMTPLLNDISNKNKRNYRIEIQNQRSNNDSYDYNISNGSNFNSELNTHSINLASKFGQNTNNNTEIYKYNDVMADRLFGFKYMIMSRPNDTNNVLYEPWITNDTTNFYPTLKNKNGMILKKNPGALPIVFATGPQTTSTINYPHNVEYQTQLYYNLFHQKYLYKQLRIKTKKINGNKHQFDRYIQTIKPRNNNQAIYLDQNMNEMDNYIDPEYKINNQSYRKLRQEISVEDQNRVLIPVMRNANKNDTVTIKFKLERDKNYKVNNNTIAYEFPAKRFIKHPINPQSTFNKVNDYTYAGHIRTTKQRPYLTSSFISEPGWKLNVDNKRVPLRIAGDYLLCAKLKPGNHKYRLQYWPPGLNLGICISILTYMLLICIYAYRNKKIKLGPPHKAKNAK